MCFGGGQPEAPINRPNYKPEDADKHFKFTKIEKGGKETDIPVEETATPPSAPKPPSPFGRASNPIRM